MTRVQTPHIVSDSAVFHTLQETLERSKKLVAIPLDILDGLITGGRLIEEGVAHYCRGIECSDNPDITLTQEALVQIKLINDYLPPHITTLDTNETFTVSFDTFQDFLKQVRTFVA